MKNTKHGTAFFGTWAAVRALAASLVIMGLLTACPNAAGGGGGTSSGSNSGGENSVSQPDRYVKVDYAALENHFNTKPPVADGVYYIEITGAIPKEWFKGKYVDLEFEAGELGKKIQAHPDKKVALKLPAEVAGLDDMSVCFYKCENLVSVANIPAGVKDMFSCFDSCTSLTQSPVIPSGVNDMSSCFDGCTSLTEAPVIPAGVNDMSSCFDGCTSLTEAPAIPSGVNDMSYCFSGCTSLTEAPVIPSGVNDMRYCFSGCTSLTEAPAIPSGVNDMRYCFSGCTSLTEAPAILSGVVKNMSSCFDGCTKLTQGPDIPASVTNMYSCFWMCSALKGVKLNCPYNGTKDAFKHAFLLCSVLEDDGILVPNAQLAIYQSKASHMGTTAPKFAGF